MKKASAFVRGRCLPVRARRRPRNYSIRSRAGFSLGFMICKVIGRWGGGQEQNGVSRVARPRNSACSCHPRNRCPPPQTEALPPVNAAAFFPRKRLGSPYKWRGVGAIRQGSGIASEGSALSCLRPAGGSGGPPAGVFLGAAAHSQSPPTLDVELRRHSPIWLFVTTLSSSKMIRIHLESDRQTMTLAERL